MCSLSGAVVSSRKGFDGTEPVARLGLLLSDTFASHGNALKELVQLVRLGLMPSDTAISQRKFEGVEQLMRYCCVTKECLEGAESVGEARSPAD